MLPQEQRRKGLLFLRERVAPKDNHDKSWSHSRSNFDEATGQVYTEKTTRILSSRDRAWTKRTVIVRERNNVESGFLEEESRGILYLNRRNPEAVDNLKDPDRSSLVKLGTCSLQEVAIEHILRNIEDITVNSLEYFPVPLIKRVWEVIKVRCAISFNTWRLFSKYLHREGYMMEDFLQYTETFTAAHLTLDSCIKPLISASSDYISNLCITRAFPVADLLKLSQIKNLGVLEIINLEGPQDSSPGPEITDRVMRGWHFSAASEGAFQILRVLRLWNHQGLTTKSLPYLNSFPALAVYDVRNCGFDSTAKLVAKDLGWTTTKETDLLQVLEKPSCQKSKKICKQNVLAINRIINEHTLVSYFGSDAKRRPRTEYDAFIAMQTLSEGVPPYDGLSETGSSFPQSKSHIEISKKVSWRQTRVEHREIRPWEELAYKTYAKVGEYRQDVDLLNAGIPLTDFVVKARDTLVPLPMVSVTLGRMMYASEATTSRSRCLAFVRMEVPEKELESQIETSQGDQGLVFSQSSPASSASSATPKSSQRKTSSLVQRSKKRKLEDVLGSFF